MTPCWKKTLASITTEEDHDQDRIKEARQATKTAWYGRRAVQHRPQSGRVMPLQCTRRRTGVRPVNHIRPGAILRVDVRVAPPSFNDTTVGDDHRHLRLAFGRFCSCIFNQLHHFQAFHLGFHDDVIKTSHLRPAEDAGRQTRNVRVAGIVAAAVCA